jgi:hypothetical protein
MAAKVLAQRSTGTISGRDHRDGQPIPHARIGILGIGGWQNDERATDSN